MKIATRDFVAAQVGIEQSMEHKDIPESAEKDLAKAQKKLTTATNSAKAQTEAGQKIVEIYKKKLEEIIKNPPTIPEVTKANNIAAEPIVSFAPKPKLSLDRFDTLKLKYSEKEVAVVRHAFKLLRDFCPATQTKLIDELIGKVIKSLGK